MKKLVQFVDNQPKCLRIVREDFRGEETVEITDVIRPEARAHAEVDLLYSPGVKSWEWIPA